MVDKVREREVITLFCPSGCRSIVCRRAGNGVTVNDNKLFNRNFLRNGVARDNTIPIGRDSVVLAITNRRFKFINTVTIVLLLAVLVLEIVAIKLGTESGINCLVYVNISVVLFTRLLIGIKVRLSLLPYVNVALPLFSSNNSSDLDVCLTLKVILSICECDGGRGSTLFCARWWVGVCEHGGTARWTC